MVSHFCLFCKKVSGFVLRYCCTYYVLVKCGRNLFLPRQFKRGRNLPTLALSVLRFSLYSVFRNVLVLLATVYTEVLCCDCLAYRTLSTLPSVSSLTYWTLLLFTAGLLIQTWSPQRKPLVHSAIINLLRELLKTKIQRTRLSLLRVSIKFVPFS